MQENEAVPRFVRAGEVLQVRHWIRLELPGSDLVYRRGGMVSFKVDRDAEVTFWQEPVEAQVITREAEAALSDYAI